MNIDPKHLQRQSIPTKGGAAGINGGEYELDEPSLKHHLEHGSYSMLSAANPKPHTLDQKENDARMRQMGQELKQVGAVYHKATGHYDGEEPSFMVHHKDKVTPEYLESLAAKYGQESVLHSSGNQHQLKFVTGPKKGLHHKGEGHQMGQFENYYSEMPEAGQFQNNIDFDKEYEKVEKSSRNLKHYTIPLAYGKKVKITYGINHNHHYDK